MTVRALIAGEWHEGENVVQIVRNIYGPGAQVAPFGDPNDTRHGQILQRVNRNAWAVLGVVRRVEDVPGAPMD